jgi:penicillin-insensitive murein endopeptidase
MMRSAASGKLALVSLTAILVGCGRAPTPLAPQIGGSIGVPHRGVLTGGAELPREGDGFKWLRQDDRHYGIPRFVAAIERAAGKVAVERPGAVLGIGDLSSQNGGQLLPHFSHRTGRDADLLLYLVTPEGAPVESPGFVHVGNDGLAWDDKGKRFLRLDVERQWLLVKTLVEDPEARIQWVFASRNVRALLIDWARARGEKPETIVRAMEVMLQPQPGGPHDDHVHIRTACTPAETVAGCEPTGPKRAWIDALDTSTAAAPPSDEELARSLLQPVGDVRSASL